MTNTLIITISGAVVATALLTSLVMIWITRRRAPDGAATSDLAAAVETAMARLQGEVGERVRSLDEKITGVAKAFISDRVRGGWGELTLQRVFEQSGLVEGRDFEMQHAAANGKSPDAVVMLPGDRKLVIDSKFPLARFSEALDIEDEAERNRVLKAHGSDIEKEAKGLKSRGYHDQAAGGFVVMYLPHEGIYVAAMQANPDLFERLLAMRVLLAGPTTLMALLGAAAHVMIEQRTVVTARAIVDDARQLQQRLTTFMGHFETVGKRLGGAVEAYNSSVGSWTARVAPQAARLADHAGAAELPAPSPIDSTPRREEVLRGTTELKETA
ncbi:MAG: DNA recombination protein RmuC [Acidimicrobiia bacterium]|nr:DNA recombination protein RmuC [Acidimicrobiia bacterium]